jgi:hypothetical protein
LVASDQGSLAVTLEIYIHTDDEAQLDALTRLQNLFDQA